MMVIALGRLGMREFDLGSDADLNFVIPDSELPELRYWTRVAERMMDIITAYTGEGRYVRSGYSSAAEWTGGRLLCSRKLPITNTCRLGRKPGKVSLI